MSEYTAGILQPCNLYNCELVDERSGSTVIRNAPNPDCLHYKVSKKNIRKGSCFCLESTPYAADLSYCFHLCLNHSGCRGATLWNNNTCTLHNCSDTDSERDAMFMERICIDCYYPPAPNNGGVELLLEGITTYPGAVAMQSCNEGYELIGNETIVCQANGLWTSSVSCLKTDTQCAKILVENCSSCKAAESCGHYLHHWTGRSKEDCMEECESDESCHLVEYTTGRTAVCTLYNCTKTVDSAGSETFLYLCNTDCGIPPTPLNGTVDLTALGVTTYRATATQSCHDGFILVGDPTIQCQASGSWTESASCSQIGKSCKKALMHECNNCEAAHSCGDYLTISIGDSRQECEEKCNQTNNCNLMVYSDGRYSNCKLYNCSDVEYHQGSDAIVYSCILGKDFLTMRHISDTSTSTTFPTEVASTSSLSTTIRILNGILSTILRTMTSPTVTRQITSPIITAFHLPYLTTKVFKGTESLTKLTTDMSAGKLTTPKQSLETSNVPPYHLAPMSTTIKTTKRTALVTSTSTRKARETSAQLSNAELTVTIVPTTGLPSKLATTNSSLPKRPVTKQKTKATVISPTKLSMTTPATALHTKLIVLETKTQTQIRILTQTTPTVIPKLKSTTILLPTTQTMTRHTKTTNGPTMTNTGSRTLSNKNPSATKPSFVGPSIRPSFTMAHTAEAKSNTSPKTTLKLKTVAVTIINDSTVNNRTNVITKTRVSTAYRAVKTTSLESSKPTRELTMQNHATDLTTIATETMPYSMATDKLTQLTKHKTQPPLSMIGNMTMTMPKSTERESITKLHESMINPVTAMKSNRTNVSMATRANITNPIPTMSDDATENVPTPTVTLTEGNHTTKVLTTIFTLRITNTTSNAPVTMVNTVTIMTKPTSLDIEMVTSTTVMAPFPTSPATDPNADPQNTVTARMSTVTAVKTIMTTKYQHSTTAPIKHFTTKATTVASADITKDKAAEVSTTDGQLKKPLSSLHTTIATSAGSPTSMGLSVINGLTYFANTHSFLDDPLNIAVISTIVAICGLGTISLGAYLHFRHEGRTG